MLFLVSKHRNEFLFVALWMKYITVGLLFFSSQNPSMTTIVLYSRWPEYKRWHYEKDICFEDSKSSAIEVTKMYYYNLYQRVKVYHNIRQQRIGTRIWASGNFIEWINIAAKTESYTKVSFHCWVMEFIIFSECLVWQCAQCLYWNELLIS